MEAAEALGDCAGSFDIDNVQGQGPTFRIDSGEPAEYLPLASDPARTFGPTAVFMDVTEGSCWVTAVDPRGREQSMSVLARKSTVTLLYVNFPASEQ